MANTNDMYASPNQFRVKGDITGITKISGKAKMLFGLAMMIFLGLVVFAIFTVDSEDEVKETTSEKKESLEGAKPMEALSAVSDGQSSVIAGKDDPKVPLLGKNESKSPNLDQQVPLVKKEQTPAELELARLASERLRQLDKASKDDLDAGTQRGGANHAAEGPGGGPMSGNPAEILAALLKGPGAQEKLLASLSAKGAGGLDDDANKQQRKESFLQNAETKLPKGYLSAVKTKPVGKYELKSTAIIPVALVDGINSDLPGTIKAIVTETVWDHLGTCPLIPQGTTAEGIYDSQIAHGQRRILAAWNKLIFRDGSTFMLEGMSSGDQAGYAGFDGDVDNHYFKVFGGAVLMSIIGAGAQYAEGPQQSGTQPSIKSTISSGLGQQIAGVSGALVQKNLSIQPTIVQKPGYKFIIKVKNDMVFPSKCGA